MKLRTHTLCALAALVSCMGPALAQSLDPAIRLPQTAPKLSAPAKSPNFRVNGGPLLGVEPGGIKFKLQGIKISGNTLFATDKLRGVVEDRLGQEVDFSVLEDVVNTISQFYRDAGYPFARAYLPAQDVQGGIVEIEVLEGRFGDITAVNAPAATPAMLLQSQRNQAVEEVLVALTRHFNESELTAVVRSIDALFDGRMQNLEAKYVKTDTERTPNPDAQAYLKDLVAGEVIESRQIERIALILDDIPGYTAVPVMRPGQMRGAGDLEVRMVEDDAWAGLVGIDNYGSQASGRNRLRFDLAKSRNAVFGDLVSFTGLVTDENTKLGSLSYSLPVNASGLRMSTNALMSTYKLGRGEFAGLADGETNRLGLTLSYPWVRSQLSNVTISAGLDHTRYVNSMAGASEKYNLESVPLSVNFDWRDSWGGSAVTYGVASLQWNHVGQDQRQSRPDASYGLFSLNMARSQRLTENVSAMGRLSVQHAGQGIDSSQQMSLGGMNAVRAFPVGEFSGFKGAVFQGELSYSLRQYDATPYVFFDTGYAKRMTTQNLIESRTLAGYGLGLRVARFGVNLDMAAAWVSDGGRSVAEPDMKQPRLWLSFSTRF